jgi:hypothetical protein
MSNNGQCRWVSLGVVGCRWVSLDLDTDRLKISRGLVSRKYRKQTHPRYRNCTQIGVDMAAQHRYNAGRHSDRTGSQGPRFARQPPLWPLAIGPDMRSLRHAIAA